MVWSLPKKLSAKQATDLIDHRVRLAKQITKFNSDSPIPDDLFDTLLSPVDQEDAMEDAGFDDEEEERDEGDKEDGEERLPS